MLFSSQKIQKKLKQINCKKVKILINRLLKFTFEILSVLKNNCKAFVTFAVKKNQTAKK
jgi:hypothetical protein